MAVEKKTYQMKSAYDGTPLSVMEIAPKEKVKGIFQVVHGMTEHKERYTELMEFMASRGFACVIHDHRGHGKSVVSRSDLGYMYGGGAESLVEDVRQITLMMKQRYPDLPVIILGHSMGSLTVRTFLKKHDALVDQVILSGSPSKNPALKAGQLLAGTQKKIWGGRHPGKLLETLSFGSFAARFPQDKSKFSWVCKNPKVREYYTQSEDCGFLFTVDGYEALFGLMEETYSLKGWHVTKPLLPVLFISGGDDPCMGNVRKFKQALDVMRMAGYRNVKGKIYPGLRHEILNEESRNNIYQDIYCFVCKNFV